MKTYELRRETLIPGSPGAVFQFFSEARNLERITPEFLQFRILAPGSIEMRPGAEIDYTLRIDGVPVRWKTVIETWVPPHQFTDVRPYKLWRHTHRFRETEGGVWMEGIVRYALPFGPLGRLAHRFMVSCDVEHIPGQDGADCTIPGPAPRYTRH
ncbi:MAG: SRPBCC family protein [Bryobacterales bacterium]|nr:SRPBCC family protein [Bryobacterales bacterium]